MTLSYAILTASAVSVTLSIVVIAIMLVPIRTVTERQCAGPDAAAFWARFTVLMLLLVPLVIVFLFALSPTAVGIEDTAARLMWRVLTATFVGHVAVLGGVALNFRQARPQYFAPPRPERDG
jgi:hypothetical protein